MSSRAGQTSRSISGTNGHAAIIRRPATVARVTDFRSEYERNFVSFDKFAYRNGKWVPNRPVDDVKSLRPWTEEVNETRSLALKNKLKATTDHISYGSILDRPVLYAELPNEVHWNDRFSNDSQHKPTDHLNGHNPIHYDIIPVAQTATSPEKPNRVPLKIIRPSSATVATQTSPDRTLALAAVPRHSDAVQVDMDAELEEDEPTRVELLRKAKYYDSKDPYIASLSRTESLKSIHDRLNKSEPVLTGVSRSSSFVRRPDSRPVRKTSPLRAPQHLAERLNPTSTQILVPENAVLKTNRQSPVLLAQTQTLTNGVHHTEAQETYRKSPRRMSPVRLNISPPRRNAERKGSVDEPRQTPTSRPKTAGMTWTIDAPTPKSAVRSAVRGTFQERVAQVHGGPKPTAWMDL